MKKSITQQIIDAYGRVFAPCRSLVLALVLLLTVVSCYGLTQLKFDDDVIKLFVGRESNDLGIATRTDQAVLVMLEADELFTPQSLKILWETSEELKQVEGVVGVVSLYDLRTPKKIGRRRTFSRVIPPPDAELDRISRAKQEAIKHPMAREQLISADGNETLIVLEVDSELTTSRQLKALLNRIDEVLVSNTRDSSVTTTLTGVPAIRVELAESTVRDELVFNVAGPLVAIAIAFVIFRRKASVVIVVLGAVTGVVWTIGVMGLIGEAINPINAVVAPLALTIGLTDSVHMLMHMREDRLNGKSRLDAATHSISTVGFPSAMTSITSAVGFVSLGIAELDVLAKFGLSSALAVVLAFISVMTVVPLLGSSFLGDHIQLRKKTVNQDAVVHDPWHIRIVALAVEHRRVVLFMSVIVTATALYIGIGVRTDPRVVNGLPTSGSVRSAFQEVEQKFGGSLPLVVTVSWGEDTEPSAAEVYAAISDVHQLVEGYAITGPPLSLVNLYQSMSQKDRKPKSLFQQLAKVPAEQRKIFFDRDAREALVVARAQDAGGRAINAMITELEDQFVLLGSEHPGFQFKMGDTVLEGIRATTFIVQDLGKSLLLAVPLTLVVIVIALRSFRSGVVALLPNIFPMAALAATMVILGQSITLTGAAVFVMCFGIAVDDTIHAITAFDRRRAAGESIPHAIVNAYRDLGDAVLSTTAILIGGLGVVMLGQSHFTRMFGAMFCIGLVWAVIGDLFILPAVLACVSKRDAKLTDAD
ncbi:MAG: MMPL family transporter [Pirellulaceae bacterium]|nr:MMPL family transporter [Pirellulaceae bacterium]